MPTLDAATSWIRQRIPAPEWLPILDWARRYTKEDARGDAIAGLTVGVMLIPQGMAYAVLAGLPPTYGLYSSLVPLLIYPLLGTSRHLAVGLNAVPMIIVAAGVGGFASEGSTPYVQFAILLTALVALLQLTMGALRLGFLANLLSRPVIAGFATAAALIILSSQVGNFLGIDVARSQYVYIILRDALRSLVDVHWLSMVIASLSVLAIVVIRFWKPIFPAELAVIVGASVVVWGFDLASAGVATVGSIPTGLPALSFPSFAFEDVRNLFPTAITLALVQFLSVVSLGRIFAIRHHYSVDANQELLAVGAANMVGSVFQCLPASGSFSRTAVNERAGAHTAFSNFVAAGVVGLTLLFLTPLFNELPMAALAAVIMVTAVGLLDVTEIRYLFHTKRVDGWVAMLTFGATLVLGIEEGVLLGIGAATIAVLYRQSRPYVAELGHLAGTRSFKNLDRHQDSYPIEGIIVLRIEAGFSFFNAQFLRVYILEKAARENVRAVILHAGSVNYLDTTGLDAIQEVAETLEQRGIEMHFAGLTGPIRDVMARAGLGDTLGSHRFHITAHRALTWILAGWDKEEGTNRLEEYLLSTELGKGEFEPTSEETPRPA